MDVSLNSSGESSLIVPTSTKSSVAESTSSAESSLSSSQAGGEAVQSFLSKLRTPKRSDLTRKRTVRQNLYTGTRVKRPSCSTNPKTVSIATRAKDFQEEHIVVSAGKLFCGVCREELSTKLSI